MDVVAYRTFGISFLKFQIEETPQEENVTQQWGHSTQIELDSLRTGQFVDNERAKMKAELAENPKS